MVKIEFFKQLALSFPNTSEHPHFEAVSFKVNGKIFATLKVVEQIACLKLSVMEQHEICSFDKAIYPVENKWGKSGWTYVKLKNIRKDVLIDALTSAYYETYS